MTDIVLKILSVAGILLLVLLGIAIAFILLVLFFPIGYKAYGKKDGGGMELTARANWLFGVLRIRYAYPDPGKLTVKLLWRTVFDSAETAKEDIPGTDRSSKKRKEASIQPEETPDKGEDSNKELFQPAEEDVQETAKKDGLESLPQESESEGESEDSRKAGFLQKKIIKIKYTISGFCDKIEEIWKNITYYTELLKEEETKQLFSHVCFRMGKIWKSIRPRHINIEVVFGTGSPDTTGYAFGVYGMLSPFLGPTVNVAPDFNQRILEGQFSLSGRITAAVILLNGLKVLLDRKLRKFIGKLKAGRK